MRRTASPCGGLKLPRKRNQIHPAAIPAEQLPAPGEGFGLTKVKAFLRQGGAGGAEGEEAEHQQQGQARQHAQREREPARGMGRFLLHMRSLPLLTVYEKNGSGFHCRPAVLLQGAKLTEWPGRKAAAAEQELFFQMLFKAGGIDDALSASIHGFHAVQAFHQGLALLQASCRKARWKGSRQGRNPAPSTATAEKSRRA